MASSLSDGWNLGGWEQPIANGEYEFRTLLPAVFARTDQPVIRRTPLPAEPDAETRSRLIDGLCSWSFSSLTLSPDEVYYCACLIFESVLSIPELHTLGISNHIRHFLHTLRYLYPNNPYHNFAHGVDVLQAVYAFLEPEVAPPLANLKGNKYDVQHVSQTQDSARTRFPWREGPLLLGDAYFGLRPIEILAFLIATVGHDVGHPGCTAQCLTNAQAPLCALAYQSPLETLHYTLLSQTLRAHGLGFLLSNPNTEELMRNVIMSTDMQLHAHYMGRFSRELSLTKISTDSREGYLQRILLCQGVLHAADICNPVRPFDCGVQWSSALIDEWSNQARLEIARGLPNTQAVWPELRTLDYQLKQAKGQVQFLDFATLPLFRVLQGILPKMGYFLGIGMKNRARWERRSAVLSDLSTTHPPSTRLPSAAFPDDDFPYPDARA